MDVSKCYRLGLSRAWGGRERAAGKDSPLLNIHQCATGETLPLPPQ